MRFVIITGLPGAVSSQLLCREGPGFVNCLLLGFPLCSFPLFEHFHQKGDERKERQLVSNPFNASEGPTNEAADFLSAWVLDDWFSFLPIDLVPSRKPWLQKAPLWCFRSSMLLCFTSVFSCLPKCVQGLVQLEIGRLRAGSWASSRKTSQNSQVGDVFLSDSLSLLHPLGGSSSSHKWLFRNDAWYTHIHSTYFSVFSCVWNETERWGGNSLSPTRFSFIAYRIFLEPFLSPTILYCPCTHIHSCVYFIKEKKEVTSGGNLTLISTTLFCSSN